MTKRRRPTTRAKTRFAAQEQLEPRRVLDSVVVFNELMYNPPGEEAMEWIELHNQMSVDVDLSNWTLEGGVDYAIPPGTILAGGEYLVIAASPDEMAAESGLDTVLGPYSGRISNGGEQLELRNHTRRLMNVVQFDDGGELGSTWESGPDGTGATLAKRNEQAGSAAPEDWTTSAQMGGTPGRPNFQPVGSLQHDLLVAIDQVWRYDQTGNDLQTAWRDPDFDDAQWPSGPAVLYVETSSLAAEKRTPLEIGPTTYYFRTQFEYLEDGKEAVLRLNHLVDDGAVFYINGQEVFRFKMDDGPVTSTTLAGRVTPRARFDVSLPIPTTVLRDGTNTLAVEVHQSSVGSDDIVFATELRREFRVPPSNAAADLVHISELAAGGDGFWVELNNDGDRSISLDNWQIGDSDGGSYTLPPQTIAAGQRSVFDASTLGFTPTDNARLFLVDDAQNLADAVRVADRPQGRIAAFADRFQFVLTTTPGEPNVFAPTESIVINEIMYHHRPTYATIGDANTPAQDYAERDEE